MSDAPSPKVTAGPNPQTAEVKERRPYEIIFVADLRSGGRLPDATPIDKESFAAVMARAKPSAAIAVPNPLGGAEWELQLACDSLKSFEPPSLLAAVPAGRWRLGVREKLQGRRRNQVSDAELNAAVQAAAAGEASLAWLPGALSESAPAASPPPAPAASGGSILDMVDAPSAEGQVSRDVAHLAASAGDAGARISGSAAGRIDNALTRIDRELNTIANALLKHPDIRHIETVWRSVKFIVERVDFREGIRLMLVDAARDNLAERMTQCAFDPAYNGDRPTPGLVVCDHAFGGTPADIELLEAIGAQAASLPTLVVVPMTAALLNVKSLRLVKNLPNLAGLMGGWEFAKWRSLRDQPFARWLAPVIGRFVLRAPWKADESPGFTATEVIETSSDVVWANGHLAMAVCSARSYAKHGWPTRMFGSEAGRIEDLSVIPNPNDPQSPWGPGDLMVPDRRVDEFPEVGLNFVTASKNGDFCMLMGGVSLARPITTAEIGKNQAMLEISLPYQQFSSVVSAYVSELMPELRGLSEKQIQEKVLFGLVSLVGVKSSEEMESVQVGTGPNPDAPGQTIVQIRLEPPGRIVPGGLKIEFGFSV